MIITTDIHYQPTTNPNSIPWQQFKISKTKNEQKNKIFSYLKQKNRIFFFTERLRIQHRLWSETGVVTARKRFTDQEGQKGQKGGENQE